ncbi:MAG: hypothetical protein EBV86_13040, partial [Marivivens sp.]|nr:hypothetical protein [Marivivens sp.]NCW69463.1 hypothetical protein [Marivivens sp.]
KNSTASASGWQTLGSDIVNSKGKLRRWSLQKTIGGAIVATACEQIVINGITWEAVALCFVGVLPLSLSMFET